MAKWEVKDGVATPADVTKALIARAQDLADLQEKMDQANRPESHRPMINCLRACAAALADATQRAEAAEERATRDELEADNWSRDYRALEKAVCGDTGLSAMLIATQAMLFKPRAEAAEARVADLTAKLEVEKREAFNRGYVIACCNLQNMHGSSDEACDVLAELGVTQPEIDALDLAEYDAEALAEIRKARKDDPVGE